MAEGDAEVTLNTLHGDLADLRSDVGGVRSEIRDLKTTIITGFAGMPTRESSEEMVRLLRAGNRLQEERFSHLDGRMREQHLETQQVLHALVEGQLRLVEGQQVLADEIKTLSQQSRATSAEIQALIRRIDALIRGRNNGEPPV